MVVEGGPPEVPAVVPGVWERATARSARVFGPVTAPLRVAFWLPLVLGVIGGLVPVIVTERAEAIVVDLVIAAGAALVVSSLLRSSRRRDALELVLDHQRLEDAEFRRETGSRRPRSRRQVEQWLVDHPVGPGRVTHLSLLGRYDEADAELARRVETGPKEDFFRANHAAARVLNAGGIPDLGPQRSAWERIEDPTERHLKRECLALQEAMVAAESGGDPVAVLAAARHDVGGVHWRSSAPWLIASSTLAVLLISTSGWLTRLTLGA